ncbi:MAG: type II secretion system minor pseudopilin GspJ [Legionellales bacterium]|nr:type II secretion system minor pseudopilin GspJ [Legionellales bacterium]
MKERVRGFTLIEILIALFVFSIMAMIATVALRRIFLDKKILNEHIAAMNQLELATAMIRLDISQMIDRPVRNNSGQLLQSVSGTSTAITFVRTGNVNPLGYFNISHLQRITYTGGGSVTRASWDVLDMAPSSKAQSKVLLSKANEWKIRYYDDKLKVYTEWPPADADADTSVSSTNEKNPLPRAVDIQFNAPPFGEVDLFIPIFAGNLHLKADNKTGENTGN